MPNHERLPLQVECTMLFQSNPCRLHSAADIARMLQCPSDEVLSVLELLTQKEIVRRIEYKEAPAYRYNEPAVSEEIDVHQGERL
ncbi:hypothetical protein ACFO4L_11795 [Bacillus daqingensis]|uniref:MarR family transcriptional regulator n=1 Tax=Bacillus daqingensis TaxID=872396 RepID=A0ABV9NYZ5_9BACI